MDLERVANRFALEAIQTARAEAATLRPQDGGIGSNLAPVFFRPEDGQGARPWYVRYRPWIVGGSAVAAYLIWRRWKQGRPIWPNPSRSAILKRRAYLRALKSSELAELQPADREHAAKALTVLFDQNWGPWLKRIIAKGVSLHDAVYWLPTQPSPSLAKFLRTHVDDVQRKRPEDLQQFMSDLESIARGWDKLSEEDRVGSVKDVAKRIPMPAYPKAQHTGLSREAAAMGMREDRYYSVEERWLNAVNKQSKKNLPEVYLHFKGFTGEYVMRNLDPADPRGLFLGAQEETKCCQKPGFQAESCAWHGVESPNGMFYVMETENGDLVAMSWAWRRDRFIVLDSIESSLSVPVPEGQNRWDFNKDLRSDIAKGFDKLGKAIIKSAPTVAEVRVGGGYGNVAQEIVRSLGWTQLSSSIHGSSRGYADMMPKERLRAKLLDEAMTKIILHPSRCYTDAKYEQFIVAKQPLGLPEEAPPIDKIVEDPYIHGTSRYRMAKKLPPSYKMGAAILGLNFSDKQRVELAKEATVSDRRNPELVALLAEQVSPRYILPFLDAMTEKQLCDYLIKNEDDLPNLFFRDPRTLYDFITRPGMEVMSCVTKKKKYGRHETTYPSVRIANAFLIDRTSQEALTLELKEQPRGKERLTQDQVYALIVIADNMTLTRIMLLFTGKRGETQMKASEIKAFLRSDVGSALRVRFVPYLRQLLKQEVRSSSYYTIEYAKHGRMLGADMNGLTMNDKLRLAYKFLDDPELLLTRESHTSWNSSPATSFVAGFLESTRYKISPKQMDRLISKMLLEHKGDAHQKLLNDVVLKIAETWGKELPPDMRFTMAMLLEPDARRGILFNYADTFTKTQIYDILNIGPMSKAQADTEARITSNPSAWGLRGVAALLGS